jgi:hypothetical protein
MRNCHFKQYASWHDDLEYLRTSVKSTQSYNRTKLTDPSKRLLDNAIIQKDKIVLYTIAVVMIILWLLGLITSNTMGGFIHILLVIAIVVVLLRVING